MLLLHAGLHHAWLLLHAWLHHAGLLHAWLHHTWLLHAWLHHTWLLHARLHHTGLLHHAGLLHHTGLLHHAGLLHTGLHHLLLGISWLGHGESLGLSCSLGSHLLLLLLNHHLLLLHLLLHHHLVLLHLLLVDNHGGLSHLAHLTHRVLHHTHASHAGLHHLLLLACTSSTWCFSSGGGSPRALQVEGTRLLASILNGEPFIDTSSNTQGGDLDGGFTNLKE